MFLDDLLQRGRRLPPFHRLALPSALFQDSRKICGRLECADKVGLFGGDDGVRVVALLVPVDEMPDLRAGNRVFILAPLDVRPGVRMGRPFHHAPGFDFLHGFLQAGRDSRHHAPDKTKLGGIPVKFPAGDDPMEAEDRNAIVPCARILRAHQSSKKRIREQISPVCCGSQEHCGTLQSRPSRRVDYRSSS